MSDTYFNFPAELTSFALTRIVVFTNNPTEGLTAMKLLEKLRRTLTVQNPDIIKDSSADVMATLTKTEAELLESFRRKEEEIHRFRDLHRGFVRRSQKATSLLKNAKTAEAVRDLESLIDLADKLAASYLEVYTREEEQYNSMQESLNKIQAAKREFTMLKDRAILEASVRNMRQNTFTVSFDEEPVFDQREINRTIHTAKALVELRTGSL